MRCYCPQNHNNRLNMLPNMIMGTEEEGKPTCPSRPIPNVGAGPSTNTQDEPHECTVH